MCSQYKRYQKKIHVDGDLESKKRGMDIKNLNLVAGEFTKAADSWKRSLKCWFDWKRILNVYECGGDGI